MSLSKTFAALILVTSGLAFAGDFEIVNLKVNGSDEKIVEAGKPIEFKFQIAFRGTVLNRFDTLHAKKMHVATFRSDLSFFSHVHPELNEKTAEFTLKLNQPSTDPDNFMAPTAIPAEGSYNIHVEFFPNLGLGGLIPRMEMIHFVVLTKNSESAELKTPQSEEENGLIVKYLNEDGSPGRGGSTYKIEFRRTIFQGDGGRYIRFEYFVKEYNKDTGVYYPITKLGSWLQAEGHSLLTRVPYPHDHHHGHMEDHTVVHGHAYFLDGPRAVRQLETYYFDRGELKPGTYRIWLQLKPTEKIFTVPLTFELD